jgi:hypothetical protein
MIIEAIRASLFAGIPILVITYLLVSRAIVSNRLENFSDTKSLNLAMKNMSKKYKEDKKQNKRDKNKHTGELLNNNRVLNKWLYFGGGFYGLMALITYFYIEIGEIFGFIGKLFKLSFSQLMSQVSFNLLIDLFIDAIRNIIDAFVWFSYWDDQITMKNGWYWLIAAYLGYMLGAQIAQREPFTMKLKDILNIKTYRP